jgi:RND family efflux transporter MFP subunit
MPILAQKIMQPLGLLVLTAIIVALLIWTRPDTQAELQPLPPARVFTDVVQRMNVQPVTRITGKLQPARKASLRLEVTGNVVERFVEPGQKVAAGEPLLQLEDGDFRDAVSEARALLSQEQNAIERDRRLLELVTREREIQEREVGRMETLGRDSLASKSKYDEALRLLLQNQEEETRLKHSVDTAEARLNTRRAALNLAERNLERSKLVAPFAGTINSVLFDVGDHISSGQVSMELVQLDELDLYLEITGQLAHQLQLGQEVKLVINDAELKGSIHAIAPDPNPVTHTHALRIRLPAENQTIELYPGQLAVAELPGKPMNDVEVVPVSSILREEGKAYVFTVEGNRISKHPVELIARQNDMQIIGGISPGTRIVARDVTLLADGQVVHAEL